jgi:hypothetical protein
MEDEAMKKVFLILLFVIISLMTKTTCVDAWQGGYLVVDGVDDYVDNTVEGPLDVGYTNNMSFTVEAWIYPMNFGYGAFVADDAYDLGYVSQSGSSAIKLSIWPNVNTTHEMYSYNSLWNGWHHIVGLFDNENNRAGIGVDGNIQWHDLENYDGLWNGTWPFVIGSYSSTSGFFEGKIDEVRVSNIVRYTGNSYEIPTLQYEIDTNTLALWHFDEAPGSSYFIDSSGNGNTLTAHNGATTVPVVPVIGDVDGDGEIKLLDALLALQVSIGLTPTQAVNNSSDVNSDGKIGLAEAVYVLQDVSGISAASEIYNPAGVWNGTINDTTSGGSGIIVDWELKDDNTMLGNWIFYPGSGGAISLNIGGSYSIDANGMSFSTTGSVAYNIPGVGNLVSGYTVTVNGSMTSSTEAEGTYSLDFSNPLWPDNSGSWSVTKTAP